MLQSFRSRYKCVRSRGSFERACLFGGWRCDVFADCRRGPTTAKCLSWHRPSRHPLPPSASIPVSLLPYTRRGTAGNYRNELPPVGVFIKYGGSGWESHFSHPLPPNRVSVLRGGACSSPTAPAEGAHSVPPGAHGEHALSPPQPPPDPPPTPPTPPKSMCTPEHVR